MPEIWLQTAQFIWEADPRAFNSEFPKSDKEVLGLTVQVHTFKMMMAYFDPNNKMQVDEQDGKFHIRIKYDSLPSDFVLE